MQARKLSLGIQNLGELRRGGYLTIKAVHGDSYVLGIPNREVRKALYGRCCP